MRQHFAQKLEGLTVPALSDILTRLVNLARILIIITITMFWIIITMFWIAWGQLCDSLRPRTLLLRIRRLLRRCRRRQLTGVSVKNNPMGLRRAPDPNQGADRRRSGCSGACARPASV